MPSPAFGSQLAPFPGMAGLAPEPMVESHQPLADSSFVGDASRSRAAREEPWKSVGAMTPGIESFKKARLESESNKALRGRSRAGSPEMTRQLCAEGKPVVERSGAWQRSVRQPRPPQV